MKLLSVLALFIALTTLGIQGNAQTVSNSECLQVRTGSFVDGTLSYVTIERDSLYQTETDTRTGKWARYKVDWIDSCTYTLTLDKTNDRKTRKADKKIGVLRISITYVDEDGYRYIATAPGLSEPFRGSIKRKK